MPLFNLTDMELWAYIQSDLPYFDLTTSLQKGENKRMRLEIFSRQEIIAACSEEAMRIAVLLGCEIESVVSSGSAVSKGQALLVLNGDYASVHQAWRLCQILLEYSCQMATFSAKMKREIAEVNNRCELLATRKSFPFAKRFCIKAIMCGGAMPHRLGLSETILFFNGHRIIYESDEDFYAALRDIKHLAPEKKIVVESETLEDAKALMAAGAEVIQVDKADVDVLSRIVAFKESKYPAVKIIAAGGINLSNVKEYAKSGVDGIVTSALYTCGMADLGSRMVLESFS